jgi:hypothetical protein
MLLTYDIHIHERHSGSHVDQYLRRVMDLHDDWGIKATFLFPAEAAKLMKETVRLLLRQGHEIGCHGLTHRKEYYDLMPASLVKETLRRATSEIEEVVGQAVRTFRAPVFRISGTAVSVLEELGYEADLSINSQRLGIFSSDPLNVRWMMAPRVPYHPDIVARPWRRGTSRIWEIPLSCFLVPFVSNTGLIFGSVFMKWFFRTLYLESTVSRKPIVYMMHPEDLSEYQCVQSKIALRWRDLIPTRTGGFGFRHALYETDPHKIVRMSKSLVAVMRAMPVRFMTVLEYVAVLNRESFRPSTALYPSVTRGLGQ